MKTVTVTVSEPFIVIGLVNGSMRPQGRRRDYRAEYNGRTIHKNNKAEMASRLRVLAYQNGERVRIEYVSE